MFRGTEELRKEPTGKKPNEFSSKIPKPPLSHIGVPVGDGAFRVAIPKDGGGSREGKGGEVWREKLFQEAGSSSVGSQSSRITLSLVRGSAG